MIRGVLLYEETDAKKNQWFIGHLIETAKDQGIDLSFMIYRKELFIGDNKELIRMDFCINRTRYSYVNVFLEARNVRCYNNLSTVKIANDKWLTYLMCKELEIPVMDTIPFDKNSFKDIEFPVVIKSKNGHGGNEVFWVNNEEELQNIEFENENGYIVQKPASVPGVDVRVYVLGDCPIIGVKRSSASDFRSNFSLGGQVEIFSPTAGQLAMIKKIQKFLATDYVGVDFMLHNDTWILNEIEDVVGARMLYSLSDYDIAEAFIKYICRDLKNVKGR